MIVDVKGTAGDGRPWGFKIDLEDGLVTDGEIRQALASGHPYEPDTSLMFCGVLRLGDSAVDVGANVGWFTLLASALVGPEGFVWAFEPGTDNLEKLRRNVALNGFEKRVGIVPKAVADVRGQAPFYHCADGSGGHALWDPAVWPVNHKSQAAAAAPTMMELTTLDYELGEDGAGADQVVRLIKIDTEGNEFNVLKGALELLEERPPDMIIAELHEFGLAQLGGSQMELRRLLRRFGFEGFVPSPDGQLPMFLPPESPVVTSWILNLAYCRPAFLSEVFPEVNIELARPRRIHGYPTQGAA